jgi:hypothetical protein
MRPRRVDVSWVRQDPAGGRRDREDEGEPMTMRRKPVSDWRRAVLALGTANEAPRANPPAPASFDRAKGNQPKRARLKPRSAKRAKLYREERVPLVVTMLAEGPCQAGPLITRWLDAGGREGEHAPEFGGCGGAAEHIHEVLPRARGGSIIDRSNLRRVCFECHRFIHDNQKTSRALGLLV